MDDKRGGNRDCVVLAHGGGCLANTSPKWHTQTKTFNGIVTHDRPFQFWGIALLSQTIDQYWARYRAYPCGFVPNCVQEDPQQASLLGRGDQVIDLSRQGCFGDLLAHLCEHHKVCGIAMDWQF
jgi:hypothetical protein